MVDSPRGKFLDQSESSSYFTHEFLFWVMVMEKKISGKYFTDFLQKLNTSWMIIDETLWYRDSIIGQSQLFWFCSSPFYPILSSHDCNPENWASNSTILFLVYKHRTKKFTRIFENITSKALCEYLGSLKNDRCAATNIYPISWSKDARSKNTSYSRRTHTYMASYCWYVFYRASRYILNYGHVTWLDFYGRI